MVISLSCGNGTQPADDPPDAGQAAAGALPAHWVSEGGGARLQEEGAASGRKFVRIADSSRLHQELGLPEDFRGDLRIRVKIRGKGVFSIYIYRYERGSRGNTPSVLLKKVALEATAWTPAEASYALEDDRILRLAFHASSGAIDVDDVMVTKEARQSSAAAERVDGTVE